MPNTLTRTARRPLEVLTTVDRRVWSMIAVVCFFGILVIKEVSLPHGVMIVLGLVGLFALLVMGIQSPELPLYVLVAYLPFSRLLSGSFGTHAYAFNMTNILTAWVLIAYVLSRLSSGQSLFQGTPFNRVVWLFCGLGTVSLLRASATYGSWYLWEFITPLKQWLTPIFFYFLTLWVVRDRQVLKTVAVLIMVTLTIVALMAIRDYMNVGDASFDESRIGGIAEHSNTLGAFFVYYMFLFLGFFLIYPKNQLKIWMLLIPFALCFRGIMVTFSRGAYLAFAAGSLAACWFRHKLLFIGAVALGLLLMANPILLPSGIRFRIGQTIEHKMEDLNSDELEQNLEASSAHRITIWRGALQMIKKHPMWGVGYGAFPATIPNYASGQLGYVDAHNSYLLIAAEMGIPTLLVFLLVLVMAWAYTYWLYHHTTDLSIKSIALGVMAGLVGLLVANMFGSRMDDQAVSSYFWILCGLVMRGVLIERAESRVSAIAKRLGRT